MCLGLSTLIHVRIQNSCLQHCRCVCVCVCVVVVVGGGENINCLCVQIILNVLAGGYTRI